MAWSLGQAGRRRMGGALSIKTGIEAVADQLMAASVGAVDWSASLKTVAAFLGCADVAIETWGLKERPFYHIDMGERQDQIQSLWAQNYLVRNPRVLLAEDTPVGKVMYDRHLAARIDIEKDEFYQDFLPRIDLAYFMGVMLRKSEHSLVVVTPQRTARQGHVTREDVLRLETVTPLFSRAVTVARTFGFRELKATLSVEDTITPSGRGLIALAKSGRILAMNQRAHALLGTGDGLHATRLGLTASLRSDNDALTRLVGKVTSGGLPMGGGVSVLRPSSLMSWHVVVMPLGGHFIPFTADPPAALVILSDPCCLEGPPPAVLQGVFDLTPREAQIASLLAAGLSLKDAACRLDMAASTAHSHLKAIFAKTETNRQAELVARLKTLLP
jgi:DNA-binding CsgD family transcriptional regulator